MKSDGARRAPKIWIDQAPSWNEWAFVRDLYDLYFLYAMEQAQAKKRQSNETRRWELFDLYSDPKEMNTVV